jgi:hypothetical protein
MSSTKEPTYFAYPRVKGIRRYMWQLQRGHYDRGWDWYASLFAHCPDDATIGEASTRYLSAPEAPRLIERANPDVRLIFSLRDPVARVYSNYWYTRRVKRVPSFDALIEAGGDLFDRYVGQSMYGKQLDAFYDVFRDEQILVLIFEELSKSPADVVRRTLEFIGVDPLLAPEIKQTVFNKGVRTRSRLFARTYSRRPLELGPRPLSTMSRAARRWNERPLTPPPLREDQRARLWPLFAEDVSRVEEIVGRRLDEWRAANPVSR